MAKFFAFATFVAGGIMLADLIIHPQGTQVLTSSAVQAETVGTNALLGVAT